jgi:hypothetical protein
VERAEGDHCDAFRTAGELIAGEASSTIRRRIDDGSEYRIVKVPDEPTDLRHQLAALRWGITVTQTSGPFHWGSGRRSQADRPDVDGRQRLAGTLRPAAPPSRRAVALTRVVAAPPESGILFPWTWRI